MAQRTTVQSMSGAVLSLSASLPATYDSGGYAALSWTAVGSVENYGNHGMNAQIMEFTAVADAIVQKLKGSKNYGTMSMTLGNIPSDTGQALIATASESTNRYSAKIQYPAGDGESTGEKHYLEALVATREFQDGSVNDVRKLAVALAICRKPVEVAGS